MQPRRSRWNGPAAVLSAFAVPALCGLTTPAAPPSRPNLPEPLPVKVAEVWNKARGR